MTRQILVVGGTDDQREVVRGRIEHESIDVTLAPSLEGQPPVPAFDVVVALDRAARRAASERSAVEPRWGAWIAWVESGDEAAVAEARDGGGEGLILAESSGSSIRQQLESACRRRVLVRRCDELRGRLGDSEQHPGWIARSTAAHAAGVLIDRIGPLRLPVLIQGESGTGKSYYATLVHAAGPRALMPLEILDCRDPKASRLGTKLFGKEQGTYSNDQPDEASCLERAHGGTLILDHVEALPEPLQQQLLEFIRTGLYKRMGGTSHERADVRVLALADRGLDDQVKSRAFRLDLFQELQALRVQLAPLRDRPEDVERLARYFLELEAPTCHPPVTSFSARVLESYRNHEWPGNVQELRETVRRSCALAEGPVITNPLASRADNPSRPEGLAPETEIDIARTLAEVSAEYVERVERAYLEHNLKRYRGQISAAAKHAGLSRKSVSDRVKKYGLPIEQYRP